MRKVWMLGLLAMAGRGAEKVAPDVVICLRHSVESSAVVALAEGEAGKMLAEAGVTVAWRLGTPGRAGGAEVIEVLFTEPQDSGFHPGALAFATLGAQTGTRIEIFYNRIQATRRDFGMTPILAHVLAHEITHVLEGISRHSENGVMKARWDERDFERMRHRALPFAEEDLHLIRDWTERHRATLMAVSPAGRPGL